MYKFLIISTTTVISWIAHIMGWVAGGGGWIMGANGQPGWVILSNRTIWRIYESKKQRLK